MRGLFIRLDGMFMFNAALILHLYDTLKYLKVKNDIKSEITCY